MKKSALPLMGIVLLIGATLGYWLYRFLHIPALYIPNSVTKETRITQINQWLQTLQAQHKFNGGVLIAHQGEPLLMKTYGVTDHTATQALTTQSSFRLASVSKQFTAVGLLVLVEQGRVDLDALVADYLKRFPYVDVTVRHLLNQTSGIPDAYMALAEKHRHEFGDALSIVKPDEM